MLADGTPPPAAEIVTTKAHANARLSKAQIEVLELLALEPRETTKTTHHGDVSGACANALVGKGFARRTARFVEITAAGVKALAEHNGKPVGDIVARIRASQVGVVDPNAAVEVVHCPSLDKSEEERYAELEKMTEEGEGEPKPRRYHIVAINEKTNKKTYCTSSPLPHDEAVTMLSKFSPHKRIDAAHIRVQLEEYVAPFPAGDSE